MAENERGAARSGDKRPELEWKVLDAHFHRVWRRAERSLARRWPNVSAEAVDG